MKKNYINIFILVSLVTFTGCEDLEFLEEDPKTFYTADNIFTSATQVDQVLLTLYSDYRDFKLEPIMKGQGTDVLAVPEFRLGGNFSDYSQITPEHSRFSDVYNFYYQLISTANTALFASELESVTYSSEAERLGVVAQARFFRAFAHGMLAELFGGVPIVTELTSEPRFDYVRATREETYQFAIDELEAILNDLPVTTPQDGRITRGAAQHYLSEFYLGLGIESGNNALFTDAINYASDVIDGGTYSLMTTRFGSRAAEPGKDVWWDMFRVNNVNYSDGNTESIWTLQIDFDAYLAGDRESYLDYPRAYMPVYRAIPGVEGVAEDVGGRGVALHRPTYYVVDSIWDPSISGNDQRNSEHNIRRTIIYNDPNFPDTFGETVPQDVIDETNEGFGWVYPIFEKLTTDQFIGLDQGQNRSNLFRDEYAVRLAETILLRAEAYYRSGNSGLAADDINMLRSRAQCDYMATAGDVDIDFILDERARELFIEENRWNTLLRMGGTVAVDRIRKYSLYEHTALTLTFNFNLWPIPQGVIDRNKDVKMAQNPGWGE